MRPNSFDGSPSLRRPAARRLSLAVLAWIGVASAADTPQDWLERMVRESGQVNFRGTLVHMCGGKVDVVHIVHRVDNGRVTERVKALDTGGREIVRSPEQVMCILPDQKTVMVGSRQAGGDHVDALLAPSSSFANINRSNYRLQMLGREHVAGQATEVIAIRPTDEFRYGYRLWLDRERAMPLKYELIDEAGTAIEQTLFTEIQFSDRIESSEVEPSIVMDSFVWRGDGGGTAKDDAGTAPAAPESRGGWGAGEMPAGFALTAVESRRADGGSGMEHLVYTDGLAAVSVFIEADIDEAEAQAGMSEMGSVNAYTTTVDGYVVTAIGDVPMRTARMIALSVQRR